jgi:hypothetical protein
VIAVYQTVNHHFSVSQFNHCHVVEAVRRGVGVTFAASSRNLISEDIDVILFICKSHLTVDFESSQS